MNQLLRYILLFTCLCYVSLGLAQDAQFTQFFSNSLYLAPSFAGKTEDHRVGASYRNQWPGYSNSFLSYTLSYDHFISKYNSGIGVLLFKDIAGASQLGNTAASLMYSYNIQLNHTWYLRPGISFGVNHYGYSHSSLVFWDQIAGGESTSSSIVVPPGVSSVWDVDAGASLMAYSDYYWIGLTSDHLLRPNQGFYADSRIPYKWSFFGGTKIIPRGPLLEKKADYFSLAYLYKRQAAFQQLDIGFYWCKNPLVLGIWYRGIPLINSDYGDAVAFLLGYKADRFSIGYSYDLTVSNLIGNTGGAHEVSLVWEFKTKKKKKYKPVPCPDF